MSFHLRAAAAAACVVLAFTACKKSSETSAQKETSEPKITGSPSDPAISLMPTWPAGKRYVMRMESAQSTEMPNMQAGRGAQADKIMRMQNRFAQEFALVATNAADSNRGLEMEILAFELETANGNQVMNYDSRNTVVGGGGAVGEAFDRIIGTKIRYLLTPGNKVLRVEGIDELMQRMEPEGSPAGGGRGGRAVATAIAQSIFNEEVLKQMIEFTGTPTNAIRIGENWTDAKEMKLPSIGTLVVSATNTLRGWQDHEGRKCARVDFAGVMSSKPGETANAGVMQMSIESGSIAGRSWFAPDVSIATETVVDQNYTVLMSGVPQRGRDGEETVRDITMSVKQRVTVKLLEVTSP